MSRRHHGRPHHHASGVPDATRPAAGVSRTSLSRTDSDLSASSSVPATSLSVPAAPLSVPAAPPPVPAAPARAIGPGQNGRLPVGDHPSPGSGLRVQSPRLDHNVQCTAPQLRRFIKSRPYVPMHELRRRFEIAGDDDDVTPVRVEPGTVYVGLPNREGMLLGELLRAGEIGYELSLDPRSPIVIGVYPMRPITRN